MRRAPTSLSRLLHGQAAYESRPGAQRTRLSYARCRMTRDPAVPDPAGSDGKTTRQGAFSAQGLVWRLVSRLLFDRPSPCSTVPRHLLVPTYFSFGRCAERQLPPSGRSGFPCWSSVDNSGDTEGSSPSGAHIARHELVSGRPLRRGSQPRCSHAHRRRSSGATGPF
jgi:hypothetical protein